MRALSLVFLLSLVSCTPEVSDDFIRVENTEEGLTTGDRMTCNFGLHHHLNQARDQYEPEERETGFCT